MTIKLQPKTVAAFEGYTKSVESHLSERWSGRRNFLSIEDDPAEESRVLGGELLIKSASEGRPVDIVDGLIHDWVGAIFINGVSLGQVMATLRDFDSHKKFYPEITESRTVAQSGPDVTGYWRLQQRYGVVPVTLEIEQEAHYREVGPLKWVCKAYARNITEIDKGLFSHGRKFPPGEGHGYLWRLYAYWSLKKEKDGVLAECRTLSLSRDIPTGLAWAIGPYVQKIPEESLRSTLTGTKKAAAAH